MGIPINGGLNYLLTNYHSYQEFTGKSLLMLGVQNLSITYEEFYQIANNLQFQLADIKINQYLGHKIDSYNLFYLLGFREVKALDVSPYEGADIIFDLQNENLPEELFERFDVIYDGGTLEHIFDISTALDNTSKMLKISGLIIHDVPAANWLDHGFYSFSPSIFVDYYNKYLFRIKKIYLLLYGRKRDLDIYSPDCRFIDSNLFLQDNFSKLQNGGAGLVICIAEKQAHFEKQNLIQHYYELTFDNINSMKKKKKDNFFHQIQDKLISKSKIVIYGSGNTCEEIISYITTFSKYTHKLFGICHTEQDQQKAFENKYHLKSLLIDDIYKEKIDLVIIASFSHNADLLYKRIEFLGNYGIEILKIDTNV